MNEIVNCGCGRCAIFNCKPQSEINEAICSLYKVVLQERIGVRPGHAWNLVANQVAEMRESAWATGDVPAWRTFGRMETTAREWSRQCTRSGR